MSVFRKAEKRFYAPSGAGDPWAIPSNGSLAGITASGVQVTDESALQLIAVMACVRILAGSVSGLPFDAVSAGEGGISVPLAKSPAIITDPFGGAYDTRWPTRREGLRQILVSLLLRGNAYLLILAKDRLGRPTRLRVLHPDRVKCVFDDTGARTYEIDRKPADATNVKHIVGISYPESPTGISPISYARNAIGLGLAAEQFGAQFFGKGAHMTGIVTVPGDMNQEKARTLKETFTASHGGLANSHTVGVLTGGADWKQISVTPEDAQFLGTRAAQNLDMAMLFGVPPHMLGQTDKTTSWGTGIEQQKMGYLTFTLDDWLGPLEDVWSSMLPAAQSACFNRNALLRTDEAGRYAVYSAARAGAIMTTNEIRKREGMPPIAGGDDIAAGLNSTASPLKDNGAKTSMSADQLGTVL